MKGFKVWRVFGIDIELHLSLIALVVLVASILTLNFYKELPELSLIWLSAAAIFSAFLLIISVLFHELAHSLVAKTFKIRVDRITLFVMGGAAQLGEKKAFDKPIVELVISIAGPLSSLLLAGIFFGVKSLFLPSTLAFHIYGWIATINVYLAVFNLMPCFPMDGGRIFRAICFWKTKDFVRATGIAKNAAIVTGILMTIGAVLFWGLFSGMWIGFIVWFFIIPFARAEYQQAILQARLQGIKAKDVMTKLAGAQAPHGIGSEIDCHPEDEIMEVISEMVKSKSPTVFVKDRGVIVGVITPQMIQLYLNGLNN